MSFIPVRTYPISVAATASTGLSLAELYPTGKLAGKNAQAQLYPKGCDVVYKFSDSASDTASVTLLDIAVNGTFASDTVWTSGTGWTIGLGVATAAGAISTAISEPVNLVPGRAYTVVYTVTRSAGSITPNLGGTAGTARSSAATFTETIIAGTTNGLLSFTTSGFTGTLDTVSVTETGYQEGNHYVPQGSILINQGLGKFLSIMSQDAASTGTFFLTLGYNEQT